MPTYEYRCTKCNHDFEQYQRVGDRAPKCPRCGSPSRKVYSSVGLIFKGSGFYTTDHRKDPNPDGQKADAQKKDDAAPPAAKESTTSTPSSSTKDSPPKKDSSPKKDS